MPDRTRRRPWKRLPTVVLAACVAFGALAAAWSVAVPLFEAPDEPTHLALVLVLADGQPYPAYDGLRSAASTFRDCATYSASIRTCPAPGEEPVYGIRPHPADAAPSKATRPDWDDLNGAQPVGRVNQMPQHPPLYYQAMATVLRAERLVAGGPRSLDRELALLRLVNALLVAPLPALAWWAARRFGLDDATSLGAALAVFGLPMLTHIGSSLNNDNLLTLSGAVLVALLAGVVRGDRRRGTAVGLGVVTGIALLTKAFAVLFPPLIVLAYVVGSRTRWVAPAPWRGGGSTPAPAEPDVEPDPDPESDAVTEAEAAGAAPGWRSALVALARPLVAAGVVTVAVAGWWYVGVHARTGRFTPSAEDQILNPTLQPPNFVPDRSVFLHKFAELFEDRFWGSFGWYTLTIPRWEVHLLSAVLVVLVASALGTRATPGGRRDAHGRLATLTLLAPVAALFAFVLVRAEGLYVLTSRLPFIQGRYLFAGITGVAVVVAIGVRRFAGRHTPWVVAGGVGLVQADVLRRVLAGYWGGPGLGPRGQLQAMAAWSGWPGELLGVLGLGLVASAAWLAWHLVAFGLGSAGTQVPAGGPVGSIAP